MNLRTLDSLTDAEKALYERWKYNATHPLEGAELAFLKTHFPEAFFKDIVRLLLEETCKAIQRQGIYDEKTYFDVINAAKALGFFFRFSYFEDPICFVWASRHLHFENKGYHYQLPSDTIGLRDNTEHLINLLERIFFNFFPYCFPDKKERTFINFVFSIYGERRFYPPQYQDTNFLLLLTMLDYTHFSYEGPSVFPFHVE